jgi:hypothetical protein
VKHLATAKTVFQGMALRASCRLAGALHESTAIFGGWRTYVAKNAT